MGLFFLLGENLHGCGVLGEFPRNVIEGSWRQLTVFNSIAIGDFRS
jgi:hypothetical protein